MLATPIRITAVRGAFMVVIITVEIMKKYQVRTLDISENQPYVFSGENLT
jgi:hypothetical protein